MIDKYYVVMVKDKEGFKRPLLNANGVPDLHLSSKAAGDCMLSLRKIYAARLEGQETEIRKGLFGRKEVTKSYTEEQKREMRWFIANSSVQGVIIQA